MADTIVSDLVSFKLRRDPAGIKVSVTSTPAFEASLKARARGDLADRCIGSDYVNVWNVREATCTDVDLAYLLFLEGSSKEGGVSVTIPMVRSRDQMVKAAEETSAWIERHFASYMRSVEVTATVKARTIMGLPAETTTAAPAQSVLGRDPLAFPNVPSA